MKKIILLALTLLSTNLFASNSMGEINLGLGYNFWISNGFTSSNVGTKSGISFNLAPYFKVNENVAVGVETGYITLASASESIGNASASARVSAIPAFLSVKLYPVENFSLFAGAGLSFVSLGVSANTSSGSISASATETFVGSDVGAAFAIPIADNMTIDPAAKLFVIFPKDDSDMVFNFNPMVNLNIHF